MSTLFAAPAHGFVADDPIIFGNCYPDPNVILEGQTYYVLATDLDVDHFRCSETLGGVAITLTAELDEFVASLLYDGLYTPITDPADVMSPPVAPSAPTAFALTSATEIDQDGHTVHRLDISLVQPTSATLHHSVVTITPAVGSALRIVIPVGQTTASIRGVKAGILYTGHANAYDTYGLVSADSNSDTETPSGDTTAPSVPTSPAAAAGILMNLVSWTGVTDDDLDHYELAVSTDAGSSFPTIHTVYTTVVALSNLTSGQAYVYKVRAVDHSGNASAYTSTVTATPRKVTGSGLSGSDIAALSINGSDITANSITAAKIAAATITANEIAADTITAGNIAANAITASELAANAVIAGKILAGTIVTADFSATATISLVSNSGATVVIDATGLTITNGKLFLQDEFGKSVLGASGFSGSWSDFAASGLYNGRFLSGVVGAIANGRTAALPYWTASEPNGASGALTFLTGGGIKATWGAINKRHRVVSDAIPVLPKREYEGAVVIVAGDGTGTATINYEFTVTWLKADLSACFTDATNTIEDTGSETGTVSTVSGAKLMDAGVAPFDAAYAQVTIDLYETGTHNASAYVTVGGAYLTAGNTESVELHPERVAASEAISVGSVLVANVASDPAVDVTSLGAVTARISSTTDASLSSTGHGLQVGPTGGVNTIMDGNEIMARNNGSASALNLQLDGGNLALGPKALMDTNGILTTYQDNAWTSYNPTIGGIGTGGHSTAVGKYFKIGKMVFIIIYLVCNANGTGASSVTVTTPTNPDRTVRQTLSVASQSHGVLPAALVAFTGGSGAVWDRLAVGATGGAMIGTDYDSGGIMVIQGFYVEA